jgi:ribonuclease HII
MTRIDPDLKFERRLWRGGLRSIAGLDEAGRGALAGPVTVGAVILPEAPQLARQLRGVRDSKQMSACARESAVPRIQSAARAWGVGFASAAEIDALGIVAAVRMAALRALELLGCLPDHLLTDFRLELPELDISQTSLVRGDVNCLSIAAASVLAKTARDEFMRDLDTQYPAYQLGKHKGYGTASHRLALRRYGGSPIHRRSFVLKEARLRSSPPD